MADPMGMASGVGVGIGVGLIIRVTHVYHALQAEGVEEALLLGGLLVIVLAELCGHVIGIALHVSKTWLRNF